MDDISHNHKYNLQACLVFKGIFFLLKYARQKHDLLDLSGLNCSRKQENNASLCHL